MSACGPTSKVYCLWFLSRSTKGHFRDHNLPSIPPKKELYQMISILCRRNLLVTLRSVSQPLPEIPIPSFGSRCFRAHQTYSGELSERCSSGFPHRGLLKPNPPVVWFLPLLFLQNSPVLWSMKVCQCFSYNFQIQSNVSFQPPLD